MRHLVRIRASGRSTKRLRSVDVLYLRTAGEDYAIVGASKVCLTLSSIKAQAQIAVRLNHNHPELASTRITYGVLNLSHYKSHSNPTPVPLGENIEITLSLDQIACRVPQGINLVWQLPRVTRPFCGLVPKRQHSHFGQVLLIVSCGQAERAMNASFPSRSQRPLGTSTSCAPQTMRAVLLRMFIGVKSLLKFCMISGKKNDNDHGIINGGIAHERWTIHPDHPLSAPGKTEWTM